MKQYAVVIVIYNPDERINASVEQLQSDTSVKVIYLVDNSDKSIKYKFDKYSKAIYIPLNKNMGIGYAQNIGLTKAIEDGYDWALTLDHDTIINDNLLKKYDEYVSKNKCDRIGIINSDYYDINSEKMKYGNENPIFIDEVISSGSLLNLNVYNQVGKMKETFFIDQVDNEYCYRLKTNHFKVLILPGKGFEHRLGNIKKKSIGKKEFYTYNQPPIRTYYRTRNIILFYRMYDDKVLKKKKRKELFLDLCRIFFENHSIQKFYYFFKGIKDGIKYKSEEV